MDVPGVGARANRPARIVGALGFNLRCNLLRGMKEVDLPSGSNGNAVLPRRQAHRPIEIQKRDLHGTAMRAKYQNLSRLISRHEKADARVLQDLSEI